MREPAQRRQRFDPAAAGRRRLQILKATLLWSSGEAWAARQLLRRLREEAPRDPEVLRAIAAAEQRLGRWRLASEALAAMPITAPNQPPTTRARTLPPAGSSEAPFVRLRLRSIEQSDGMNRTDATLLGHAFIGAGLRASASAATATLPNQQAPQRVHAGLRQDLRSGSWLRARAVVGRHERSRVGASARLNHWDRWGDTRIDVAWRTPNWALPVLTAVAATRSAIGLRRTLRALPTLGRALAGDVSAELSVHVERWRGRQRPIGAPAPAAGATGQAATDAASGVAVDQVDDLFVSATVRYVSWRSRPKLWVAYSVIAVRQLGSCTAADDEASCEVSASQTGLLPQLFTSTQIHSLNVGARLQLWRHLAVVGHGGYGVRFGGANAGQAGATLSWAPPLGWRAELSYSRGFQASSYGVQTSRVQAQLSYTF